MIHRHIASLLVCIVTILRVQSQIITAPIGQIKGVTESITLNGMTYEVTKFLGIPYAKPPINELRFKKPEPVDAWGDVIYNATELGPSCFAVGNALNSTGDRRLRYNLQPYYQSEDCLQVNVYYPGNISEIGTVDSKAVMVFIHGGGYMAGNQNGYEGSVLSAVEDIIYVTMNYRLGLFGFAVTSDAEIPGNMGIFDQHLALQWIQENIPAFGGDRSRVTIFGESAGADSVLNHFVSPMSSGLFIRGISQSPPMYFKVTRQEQSQFIKGIVNANWNCGAETPQEILNCLQLRSADEINTINENEANYAAFSASPVFIDGEFVLDNYVNIFQEGSFNTSLDLIIGYNGGDGDLILPALAEAVPTVYTTGMSAEIALALTGNLLSGLIGTPVIRNSDILLELIYREYLRGIDNPLYIPRAVVQLASDAFFGVVVSQVVEAIVSHNGNGRVYRYDYNYRSRVFNNYFLSYEYNVDILLDIDAGHGDELYSILGIPYQLGNVTDLKISASMMKSWSEFAKNGQPVYINSATDQLLTWSPITAGDYYVLVVDESLDDTSLKNSETNGDQIELWDTILPQINSLEANCPTIPATNATDESIRDDQSGNEEDILSLSKRMTDILLITCASALLFFVLTAMFLHCYIVDQIRKGKR